MRIIQSSTFSATADTVFELLRHGETIVKLTKGFPITYDVEAIPAGWKVGEKVNICPRLFGWPQGDHFVVFQRIDQKHKLLLTHEHGANISQWDHTMEIKPRPGGHCHYTDIVVIKAGPRTPLVGLLAKLLYRHRHKRLHKLLKM